MNVYDRLIGAMKAILLYMILSCTKASLAYHHMHALAVDQSFLGLPGEDDKSNTLIKISNQCTETIWPAVLTQYGRPPLQNGFQLDPSVAAILFVGKNWQGRIWARTNCTFNDGKDEENGETGKPACVTGDCQGKLDCQVSGNVPATLAEFTLNSKDEQSYYDISLVDGYNLPMAIVVSNWDNVRQRRYAPPNVTNPSCAGTAAFLAAPDFWPYEVMSDELECGDKSDEVEKSENCGKIDTSDYHENEIERNTHERGAPVNDTELTGNSTTKATSQDASFLGTNKTFPLPFDRELEKDFVETWCPLDLQLTSEKVFHISEETTYSVWQNPQDSFAQFNPCFSACSKWTRAEDCCTGAFNSPRACRPNTYAQRAKQVCPDAYSYAYDDEKSTFVIPADEHLSYEVVFCPGGRSTRILANLREQARKLKIRERPNFPNDQPKFKWRSRFMSKAARPQDSVMRPDGLHVIEIAEAVRRKYNRHTRNGGDDHINGSNKLSNANQSRPKVSLSYIITIGYILLIYIA